MTRAHVDRNEILDVHNVSYLMINYLNATTEMVDIDVGINEMDRKDALVAVAQSGHVECDQYAPPAVKFHQLIP